MLTKRLQTEGPVQKMNIAVVTYNLKREGIEYENTHAEKKTCVFNTNLKIRLPKKKCSTQNFYLHCEGHMAP